MEPLIGVYMKLNELPRETQDLIFGYVLCLGIAAVMIAAMVI